MDPSRPIAYCHLENLERQRASLDGRIFVWEAYEWIHYSCEKGGGESIIKIGVASPRESY